MKNLRRVLSIVLAVALCLSLASCSLGDTEETKITNDNIKIGIIIPGKAELGDGEVNDFNSLVTVNAVNRLTSFDYGISSERFHYKEEVNPTDATAVKDAITSLLNLECNLIFLADEGYCDYVGEFAGNEDNKDVMFVCNGLAEDKTTENVFSYNIKTTDGEYLMGMIAGLKASELGSNVGFIIEDKDSLENLNSFASGVQSISNDVRIAAVTGIENADKLIDSGCRVLASDFYTEEIDNIANKNGIYYCGYGAEEYTDADYTGEESYLLCSPLFDLSQFYMNTIKAIVDESTLTNYEGSFVDSAVYLSGFGNGCADITADAVATAETALADGSLHTSTTTDGLLSNVTIL